MATWLIHPFDCLLFYLLKPLFGFGILLLPDLVR
jgi:hypothetical protein